MYILDSGKMDKDMELESKFGKMDLFMKVSGKMEKLMDLED